MTNENQDATRSRDEAPMATISIDADVKARLVELAGRAGVDVDEFVERILRSIAGRDVVFERGVPVFPRRLGARVLTVEEVDRLASE